MPKALLLENIHPDAAQSLRDHGFEVECLKGALNEDELIDALEGVALPRGQGVRTWPAAAHAGLPALSARSVPLPPRISKKPCAAYLCRIHLFFAAEAPHLSERPRRAGRAGRKGLESRQVPNRRRRYQKS